MRIIGLLTPAAPLAPPAWAPAGAQAAPPFPERRRCASPWWSRRRARCHASPRMFPEAGASTETPASSALRYLAGGALATARKLAWVSSAMRNHWVSSTRDLSHSAWMRLKRGLVLPISA